MKLADARDRFVRGVPTSTPPFTASELLAALKAARLPLTAGEFDATHEWAIRYGLPLADVVERMKKATDDKALERAQRKRLDASARAQIDAAFEAREHSPEAHESRTAADLYREGHTVADAVAIVVESAAAFAKRGRP